MLHVVFSHAYFVLIPLALLEGPLLSIVCGAAAGMGALNPFIAYGILVGGDLGPDLMYYAIGRWGATMPFVRRYASRIQAIRDNFLSLEQLWRTHPLATMASAKLSYLLSPALIVSAGLSGMPLRRFVSCSLTVSTVHLGALAALGYGLAKTYGYFHLSVTSAAIFLAVPGLAILAGFGYVTILMRRRLRPKDAAQKSNLIKPRDRSLSN
jgi:membrane protein DedA with SNARE-associated domain